MADSTVGALTAASALTGTELFYGVQAANDVKVTAAQIATFTGGGGGGGMAIGGSITSATLGSVLFAGTAGVLAQNNTQFFWDNTNHSLNLSGTPAVFKVPNVSGDNWFESGGGNFAVTGYNNFGTGPGALLSVTTGHDNVGLGSNALFSLTTGGGNFAVGTNALVQNTAGDNNTAIGIQALEQLNVGGGTSGNNAALGLQAGKNFLGTNSLFIGTQCGLVLGAASGDTFVGFQSASSLTSGNNNIAIGTQTWDGASSGSNNTMIGQGTARQLSGGNFNTIIGRWQGPSGASISRVIGISDGTQTNLNLDYNFTRQQVWSFNYDQYWGNPVGLHVYNMQDPGASPANYERGVFDWNINSNILTIGTQAGGTGVKRLTAIDGFAKAGAPAAGDLPSGSFALIDDTSGGATWLVFNKAGTIRKVQLT